MNKTRNKIGTWVGFLLILVWCLLPVVWIISLPLLGVFASNAPLGVLDYLGILLWLVGLMFEAGSDWQLPRSRRNPANAGAVLDHRFWHYTRRPNYFGSLCVWWGFWCMAASAGAWWSALGPALLTWQVLAIWAANGRRNMPTTS